MKKLLFSLALLFLIDSTSQAQEKTENDSKKNELKLNVASFLAGMPEFGYEYLFDEESSIGIDLLFSIDDNPERYFGLTSYYRFYFGNKRANGFFAEGFGMLNTHDTNYYEWFSDEEVSKATDFALGVSIGGKFVTQKNFVFEIYFGIGRNLFNNNAYDTVARGGITFSKRF